MILQALSVCSGILGLDLAAHRHGFTTVATCEMDPDCQKVIGYYLPGAHQFSNIYDVSRTSVRSAGIKAGLPRKSRLKMFGNGVAPDHPAEIYKFIAAECRGELLEVA